MWHGVVCVWGAHFLWQGCRNQRTTFENCLSICTLDSGDQTHTIRFSQIALLPAKLFGQPSFFIAQLDFHLVSFSPAGKNYSSSCSTYMIINTF